MKNIIKKAFLSPWTAVLTLLIVAAIRSADPGFVESVRLRYFDTLIMSPRTVEPVNIHTVNIDEQALAHYGQWPLPRGEYGRIVQELYQRNAGLVVFNVLMPDADRMGQDRQFAEVMNQHPVVLPSMPSIQTRNQPRSPGSAVIGAEYSDLIVQYPGLIANLPILENSAAGVGIVNTLPEVDGVNRRIPLIITVDGKIYPGLAIEILRVVAQDNTVQIRLSEFGVERIRIPSVGSIATDQLGRIWIDWAQNFQNHSLMNLPKDFNGGIVIVGTTAAGLANPVPSSRGAVFPHNAQAAVLGTLMSGNQIVRPNYANDLEITLILALGLILIFLMRWTYAGLVSTLVAIAGVVGVSFYAFHNFLFLFDGLGVAIGTTMVALHAYMAKFLSEFLQKQQIKKQFGTYLSPAMVEKLQKNPDLLKLGGEERELSIMFTDVRGFTSISEHYGKNVQGLTQIMNRYMTAMTRKIIDNNGTLDKYIGDAQMAFWNAPLDDKNHAKNSVKTALEMMNSLDDFNSEIAKEGVPPFGMGLGINTATVVVGNMGSDQRFDYTCLGDGVNLASRLEGQSKPYGVKIVLGPITAEQIKDEFFVLELDCIAVKGKKEGVTIYTVFHNPDPGAMPEWLMSQEHHDLMLAYYRKQQWDKAINAVNELKGEFDGQMDHYYDLWLTRIEEMRNKSLPENWDGTYISTSK
jgi:adenylate cyclase